MINITKLISLAISSMALFLISSLTKPPVSSNLTQSLPENVIVTLAFFTKKHPSYNFLI